MSAPSLWRGTRAERAQQAGKGSLAPGRVGAQPQAHPWYFSALEQVYPQSSVSIILGGFHSRATLNPHASATWMSWGGLGCQGDKLSWKPTPLTFFGTGGDARLQGPLPIAGPWPAILGRAPGLPKMCLAVSQLRQRAAQDAPDDLQHQLGLVLRLFSTAVTWWVPSGHGRNGMVGWCRGAVAVHSSCTPVAAPPWSRSPEAGACPVGASRQLAPPSWPPAPALLRTYSVPGQGLTTWKGMRRFWLTPGDGLAKVSWAAAERGALWAQEAAPRDRSRPGRGCRAAAGALLPLPSPWPPRSHSSLLQASHCGGHRHGPSG